MKNKIISMLLAVAMLSTLIVGCGQEQTGNSESASQNNEESKGQESTPVSEKIDASVEEEEKELITIEHLSLGYPQYQETFDNYFKDSDVYKELVKQTGVQMEESALADDQAQVRMASGDLGDLITLNNTNQLADLVESEMLIPLNDLIAEYAPEIMEQYPERWEIASELYENEEGLVYALPVRAGQKGWTTAVQRYLYTVRWDLYKELGYPEMNTPEDLIEVLVDMNELQPKTEDGKKVYPEGFFVTDTSYFGMVCRFQGTYGKTNIKGHYITRNVQTDELIYDFINEESPYWMAVDYYNKAYRAGILDPDSFTQARADYENKFKTGECWSSLYYSDKTWVNAQLEKDPESIAGFSTIPVEGCMVYDDEQTITGWTGGAHSLCIPTSCENPERVVEFIKYLFSAEGGRLIFSGVEGIHWDYVDGVPTYNEETLKLYQQKGEEYNKLALFTQPLCSMVGMNVAEVASDGYKLDLAIEQSTRSRLDLMPYQIDYCAYYDVEHPINVMQQMVEEDKMYSLRNLDGRIILSKADEDISRIDSACMKIAIEAIPKLVTAADDAAFESVKADTLAAFKAAGAEEAEAFYTEQWEANKAKYK